MLVAWFYKVCFSMAITFRPKVKALLLCASKSGRIRYFSRIRSFGRIRSFSWIRIHDRDEESVDIFNLKKYIQSIKTGSGEDFLKSRIRYKFVYFRVHNFPVYYFTFFPSCILVLRTVFRRLRNNFFSPISPSKFGLFFC